LVESDGVTFARQTPAGRVPWHLDQQRVRRPAGRVADV